MKLKFKDDVIESGKSIKCEKEEEFNALIEFAKEKGLKTWYGELLEVGVTAFWRWGPETCVSLSNGWIQDYESMEKEKNIETVSFNSVLETIPFKYKYEKLKEEKENEKSN